MASLRVRLLKCSSVLITILLLLANILFVYHIQFEDSLLGSKDQTGECTGVEIPGDNSNALGEANEHDNRIKFGISSRSGNTNEAEPNNDITNSVNNGNELTHDTDMLAEMRYSTDELDIFYIDLNGGGKSSIDRVNITPIFTDPNYITHKVVGIQLKMYTEFDGDLFLLEYKLLGTDKAINNDTLPWKNSTTLFFNADKTGRYYLKVYASYIRSAGTGQIIDPDALINYTLKVSITSESNTDLNNDIYNGTKLTGPLGGLALYQANDHWDWYTIESLTENRAINISLNIEITSASQTDVTHHVNVTCILKCFDLDLNREVKLEVSGDWKSIHNLNPMDFYLKARFSKAYLGIHIQQLEYVDTEWVEMPNCGLSNIAYKINTFKLTLVNKAPKLLLPSLTPNKGNLQDEFIFSVIYQDSDNDQPLYVNVTIDEQSFEMSVSTDPSNDGNYANGELYELTIKGSEMGNIPHERYKVLYYNFSTIDYYPELSIKLSLTKTQQFTDLKIIDNVIPTLNEDLPEYWIIKEDSVPVYVKLFKIFNDPDRKKYDDEVTFTLWNTPYGWTNITGTDNLTVSIMDNNTIKLVPTLNQFGSDTISFRAYDVEGKDNAVFYDMKVKIEPVNDNPRLQYIMDFVEKDAFFEDKYVNITFTANDLADMNQDLIYYSTDILDKIPSLVDNREINKFSFSNLTGKLSFIPDNDMVGLYYINVTATDEGEVEPIGLSDTVSFKLQIKNTNDPPVAEIVSPKENEKFNTSSVITLNAENSTDDDLKHGDRLTYFWYVLLNGTEEKFIGATDDPTTTTTIKDSGYHVIKLTIKDRDGLEGTTTVDVRIISLIGDIPGGDDSDEDGLPDLWELRYDLDPDFFDSDEDPDNDGFTNLEEFLGEDKIPGGGDSSDPTDALSYPGDLDADSMPDWWELEVFNSISQLATGDPDNDGYSNLEEYLGPDKIPGNDDWSDPLNNEDRPIFKKDKDSDKGSDYGLILIGAIAAVVVIIVLLILFIYISNRRKKQKEEEEKEKQKKSGEKVPLYTPMPQPPPMMPPPISPQMVPPSTGPAPPPGGMQLARPLQPPLQKQPQVQLGLPAAGHVLEVEDKNSEKK